MPHFVSGKKKEWAVGYLNSNPKLSLQVSTHRFIKIDAHRFAEYSMQCAASITRATHRLVCFSSGWIPLCSSSLSTPFFYNTEFLASIFYNSVSLNPINHRIHRRVIHHFCNKWHQSKPYTYLNAANFKQLEDSIEKVKKKTSQKYKQLADLLKIQSHKFDHTIKS
jgi:hypothetical protein